jgi:CheY-like chemotaxis protein
MANVLFIKHSVLETLEETKKGSVSSEQLLTLNNGAVYQLEAAIMLQTELSQNPDGKKYEGNIITYQEISDKNYDFYMDTIIIEDFAYSVDEGFKAILKYKKEIIKPKQEEVKLTSKKMKEIKQKKEEKIIEEKTEIDMQPLKRGRREIVKKDITILYVEDEEKMRGELAGFLSLFCKRLFLAENGEEGIALYKRYRPDIIISDIKMPKMNGIEMVRAIKKIDKEQSVIFLSAHSDKRYFMETIELKIDAYIFKPIDLDLLTDKINSIFSKSEKQEVSDFILSF